ncbi:MAG: tetratricopeptide repeat protein [Panacagrimonas sp.]
MRHTLIAVVVAALAGCANPLNRVTSDRYSDDCASAEASNDLPSAEILCGHALANVDMGKLGPDVRAQKQYNLGRIKRRLSKFAEAEQIQRDSLSIQETLSGPTSPEVGRRLAELSIDLAGQNKWREGIPVVDRLLTLADLFSGVERATVKEILSMYATQAASMGLSEASNRFKAKAGVL